MANQANVRSANLGHHLAVCLANLFGGLFASFRTIPKFDLAESSFSKTVLRDSNDWNPVDF